jgi:hypothetical protein
VGFGVGRLPHDVRANYTRPSAARLKSAARAVRAAAFLRAVHPPCSGWNDGDARNHICGPFLGGFVRAHAGVGGEHLALHQQREVAGADHRTVRKQPVERHIVDQKHARLRMQERILDRRRLGLRIEDLERLPDLVFLPHLVAERDRERTVAQDDDRRRGRRTRARRSVRRQERVCERKRESGVGVVGVHHLAMTSLQHSRPVRPVGWRCRGFRPHRRRRKPRELDVPLSRPSSSRIRSFEPEHRPVNVEAPFQQRSRIPFAAYL